MGSILAHDSIIIVLKMTGRLGFISVSKEGDSTHVMSANQNAPQTNHLGKRAKAKQAI
jgi:hypothetical protein